MKPHSDRLHIEYRPIDSLIMYARNPRKNDPQIPKMVAAISEFGFRLPILIKSDGNVIDGHLRIKAARQLGMTELPCVLGDGMSDAQVRAFRLLCNRSVSWAEWDDELLALEFQDLQAADFDLEMTGFGLDEIAGLLTGDPGGEPPEEGAEAGHRTLADRFGVPPFSVLDARQGYWQERKRAWLSLGIQSELGRGDNLGDISASMAGITDERERESWNAARRSSPKHTSTSTYGAIPRNKTECS
ncbi:MAG: ParB N-terminal domain-containing protein [Dehalococcoidales bacterium]|nr:ParB N-terminal domain-containing protein [Dehalococcoidales bacterium]